MADLTENTVFGWISNLSEMETRFQTNHTTWINSVLNPPTPPTVNRRKSLVNRNSYISLYYALICNLPSVEVWVRKEYLTDHQSGHGEFVKGVWVSCKSIPGRTFYFETYLPEYAAMYDKLPISASC